VLVHRFVPRWNAEHNLSDVLTCEKVTHEESIGSAYGGGISSPPYAITSIYGFSLLNVFAENNKRSNNSFTKSSGLDRLLSIKLLRT
jgi:hypothetical protein